jgi:hypothetical protein
MDGFRFGNLGDAFLVVQAAREEANTCGVP